MTIKFGLAEVAPFRGIGHVTFPVHLVGVDRAVVEAELRGESRRFLKFPGGQSGRDGGDGQRPVSQDAVGGDCDQGAINAAGKRGRRHTLVGWLKARLTRHKKDRR